MKKIVICGGHLTPALSLIEELKKDKNLKIIFFGREFAAEGSKNQSAEYKAITSQKIKFVKITSGRLQRKFTPYTLPSLVKVPIGFIQSFLMLAYYRPSLVVAFGGYLSTPAVFSAWLLGIDTIIHEQASSPGLANRANAIFAKKIYTTWPTDVFDRKKTEVVGNLTQKSLFKKDASDKKVQSFIKNHPDLIFVTGGNQGSHFLNKLTRELQMKRKDLQILHQVGTLNFDNDIEKSKQIKNANYQHVEYLDSENIGAAFNSASIIIARSGANTVWDIATLSKAAILVPLANTSGDEQLKNAQILESAGTALILTQKDANINSLIEKIETVKQNLKSMQKNARDFEKTLKKDAAEKIAATISKIA